jgi:hypothetical protein
MLFFGSENWIRGSHGEDYRRHRAISQTLEDGIVERHELNETLPALDDVIRECVRLKHWLERRHQKDFPHKR